MPVDTKTAADFLKRFGPLSTIIFQWFKDKSGANVAPGWKAATKMHKGELEELNRKGAGIFFMVNQGTARNSEGVTKVRAVFADLDGSPLEPVNDCPLKPHIIVESSPGRFHVYWFVSGLQLSDFEGVQRSIARKYNADESCIDLPRVLRVPGYYHRKKEDFIVKVIESNNHESYTATEILKTFEPIEDQKKKDRKLPDKFTPGNQHNLLVSFSVGNKKDYGLTESEMIKMLQVLAESRGHRTPALDELENIAQWTEETISKDIPILNDYHISKYMHDIHYFTLKYCYDAQTFLYWKNSHWEEDLSMIYTTRKAFESVTSYIDKIPFKKASTKKQAITAYTTTNRIKSVIEGYKTVEGSEISFSEFDQNPYLLNVKNGTIDLRTGELTDPSPKDYITKVIPIKYDKEADCPKWKKFLKQILLKDELINYLQIVEGYCTTGITTEQLYWIYYGSGGNGKSVFMNTLKKVRGPYATITNSGTFATNKFRDSSSPNPGLRNLKGYRDIVINETSKGFEFDGQNIKNFVDAETELEARRLNENPIHFIPVGKLRFVTNVKPRLKVDGGFRRRIKFIPFTVQIEENKRNKNLDSILFEEKEGILNWLVQGAVRYFSEGMIHPESVELDTQEYLDSNDPIASFLNDECIVKKDAKAAPAALYEAYTRWHGEAGEHYKLSTRQFKQAIEEKGFSQSRSNQGRHWEGIGILDPQENL